MSPYYYLVLFFVKGKWRCKKGTPPQVLQISILFFSKSNFSSLPLLLPTVISAANPNPGQTSLAASSANDCKDVEGKRIPHDSIYIPFNNLCQICVCEFGTAKNCKTVLCHPPQDCKTFEVGAACCEFICMDRPSNGGGGGGGSSNSGNGSDFFNL